MEVHKLKPNYKKKKGKRVGRGGKRGTFSGRGQKGQKARAGHSIRPAERDLISKLPKLRGTKNSRKELNLNDLQKLEEKIINKEVLKKHGIIKSAMETVKVLGTGKISRPVVLKGITASASAKKKIEEAGGSLG